MKKSRFIKITLVFLVSTSIGAVYIQRKATGPPESDGVKTTRREKIFRSPFTVRQIRQIQKHLRKKRKTTLMESINNSVVPDFNWLNYIQPRIPPVSYQTDPQYKHRGLALKKEQNITVLTYPFIMKAGTTTTTILNQENIFI